MIAGTPVARWSWGEPGHETDLVREAVRRFLSALGALERYRLGTPHGGRVAVEVPGMGRRGILLRADFPVGALTADVEALVVRIKEGIAAGEIGGVNLYASCDGIVETGAGGGEVVEGLFELTAAVSEGYFHVGLTAFSDAWMPSDLRGRAQEAVFAANRPRLASALAEIAEELDVAIDPEDATWFGFPTESGIENHYEPRDAADLDAYRAGLVWLDRLQEAYDRGLSPTAALVELGKCSGDPVAGRPEANAAVDVDEFGKLALLALE
ncbi:hypothetical protein [Streptomyces sp. NPDC059564]|uniref:hypothetical protein n=1 Tax=Streptomyces sp. NPDC059564 TaxID=3346865 RepID=UPI0036B5B6E4